jgi:glycosyltransferase involved in cell wall biosynthesis
MSTPDEHGQSRPGATTGRPARVLLLIKCLDYGGAERLLVDMAARGDRTSFDYEAAFVLSERHRLADEMRSTGTPVHALGARGDWDLKWTAALRRLLVDRHYDLIHFHLPYAASLGRLVVQSLPKDLRPKLVYTQHCTWGEMEVPVRILNRATIGLDDALVTVSEASRQGLPKALRRRAQVIIHGVDVSRSAEMRIDKERIRREVRDELGVRDGDVLVLAVANLRPEKGYDILLEAARIVLAGGAPVSFVSVGYGPLADELNRIHGDLGLGDRFRFLGPRADVLRLMTAADVFTLPSRHEGLPVAVMEATSAGLPLVLSAVGEIPNLFTDGVDALLVPPGRADLLAIALERLVRNPTVREELGKAVLERSAMFDVTSAAHEVEDIYRRLLSERP